MKKTIALTFFALLTLFSSNAFAVDQITVSPPNPREGDAITISFRTSWAECESADQPVVWELSGIGAVRDLIVDGIDPEDLIGCVPPDLFQDIAIDIGTLPAGNYEIHIRFRDPDDGPGGLPSASLGSIAFGIGEAIVPIPTLNTLGLALLVLSMLGLVWANRRGVSLLQ